MNYKKFKDYNPNNYFANDFSQFDIFSAINYMCAVGEKEKKEQIRKSAGIESEGDFEGVPSKNIDFKYDSIVFKHENYICYINDKYEVFDKNANLLFIAEEFDYLGKGIYIVYEEKVKNDKEYGYLFKDGKKQTKSFFRKQFMSKFEGNFAILGYKNFMSECIVDTNCEVIFKNEKSSSHIYLINNIAKLGYKYYNLFTKEVICESYSSELKAGNLRFVETGGQVFKIDTITCEFEAFGEAKKIEEKKPKLVEQKTETLPKIPKQSRNELCKCGATDENGKRKKYKNCCGKL